MWTFSYSLRRCSSENSCQIFLSSLQIQSSFELKPKSQFELTHGNEHFCFCEWVLVNGAKDHGWLLWTNTNTKTHKLISNEFKKQNLHKFHIIKNPLTNLLKSLGEILRKRNVSFLTCHANSKNIYHNSMFLLGISIHLQVCPSVLKCIFVNVCLCLWCYFYFFVCLFSKGIL